MRLALLATAGLLALPATAAANHVPDATYSGEVTTGQGGTVELVVSEDGSTVDASFEGLGNVAGTCTGVGFGSGPQPITNHAFNYSGNMGQITASGSFGPSFAAGSAQVLTNPCTTGSQSWIVDGPDAFIDLGGSTVGRGVLNNTGEGQTDTRKVPRKGSESFPVVFENVGENAESYTVKGCKSTKQFKVSYKDLGNDITDAVVAGEYETELLNPGGNQGFDLKIKAKKSAKRGKALSCKVTQRSSEFVDVVKAKLQVR